MMEMHMVLMVYALVVVKIGGCQTSWTVQREKALLREWRMVRVGASEHIGASIHGAQQCEENECVDARVLGSRLRLSCMLFLDTHTRMCATVHVV